MQECMRGHWPKAGQVTGWRFAKGRAALDDLCMLHQRTVYVLWRPLSCFDGANTAAGWSPGTVLLPAERHAAGGSAGRCAVCYKHKRYGCVIMHAYKREEAGMLCEPSCSMTAPMTHCVAAGSISTHVRPDRLHSPASLSSAVPEPCASASNFTSYQGVLANCPYWGVHHRIDRVYVLELASMLPKIHSMPAVQ